MTEEIRSTQQQIRDGVSPDGLSTQQRINLGFPGEDRRVYTLPFGERPIPFSKNDCLEVEVNVHVPDIHGHKGFFGWCLTHKQPREVCVR